MQVNLGELQQLLLALVEWLGTNKNLFAIWLDCHSYTAKTMPCLSNHQHAHMLHTQGHHLLTCSGLTCNASTSFGMQTLQHADV